MKHLLIFLVCSLLVNSMTADNLFGDGEMTRDQAVDHACRMTRNYAKRQMTWFRHRFAPDYIVNDVKSRGILTKALHFLE